MEKYEQIDYIDDEHIHLKNGKWLELPYGKSDTVVYAIRHCEKLDRGIDPPLSKEGVRRADKLRDIFMKSSLTHIITSPTRRTRETIMPCAAFHDVDPIFCEPEKVTEVIDELRKANVHRHLQILVCGHQPTIPALVEQLTGESQEPVIPAYEYNRFYWIALSGASGTLTRFIY